MKSDINVNRSKDFLDQQKYFEQFTANYKEKKLDVKISKINFTELEACIFMITDNTENLNFQIKFESEKFKNLLVASFSHELRTPINIILCLLVALLDSKDLDISLKENIIKPAYYSTNILINFVNDVMDYSMLLNGNFKFNKTFFDLEEFLLNTIEFFSYQAFKKDIKLIIQIDCNSPKFLFSDLERLRQIIIHLMSNAIKFTKNGKLIN